MKRGNTEGLYIVVDGLDGIGKGEVERALISFEQRSGKAVFDTIAHSKAYETLPELEDFWGIPYPHFNSIIVAEPTYEGIGKTIREEIISEKAKEKGRTYSASAQIEMYSRNREVQLKVVVIPAREHGINVFSSRSCCSTCTYQVQKATEEGKNLEKTLKEVLNHEGNKLQLNNCAPSLLIIPTINDVSELESRIEDRGMNRKKDHAIFEDIKFQGKLKPLYESDWLREIFESHGTKVAYLNAGISEQGTRDQAVEIYKHFLYRKEILEKYRKPEF